MVSRDTQVFPGFGSLSRRTLIPLALGVAFSLQIVPASATTGPVLTCDYAAPVGVDSDGDLVSDEDEALYGTDPTTADMDGDGLTDYEEMACMHTSAGAADSDGDGVDDPTELAYGSDPLDPSSNPEPTSSETGGDSDGDGVDDATEIAYGSDPNDATSNPEPTSAETGGESDDAADVASVTSLPKTGTGMGDETRVWSTLLAVGGGLALGGATVRRSAFR